MVKTVAGFGVALPESIVCASIDAFDGAPFFEDVAEAVAGFLPFGGVSSEFFSFRNQLLLARDGLGPLLCFGFFSLFLGGEGVGDDAGELALEQGNVADHCCAAEGVCDRFSLCSQGCCFSRMGC